jgi:hypothetical protein
LELDSASAAKKTLPRSVVRGYLAPDSNFQFIIPWLYRFPRTRRRKRALKLNFSRFVIAWSVLLHSPSNLATFRLRSRWKNHFSLIGTNWTRIHGLPDPLSSEELVVYASSSHRMSRLRDHRKSAIFRSHCVESIFGVTVFGFLPANYALLRLNHFSVRDLLRLRF